MRASNHLDADRRAKRRFLAAASATLALCLLAGGFGLPAAAQDRASLAPGRHDLSVKFTPLPSFQIRDNARTRFGALTWLGGGVLSSSNEHFGGLSAIEGIDGGTRVLTISDNGLWVSMDLKVAADGAPVGVGAAWIAPMLDAGGNPMITKSEADSEGLALRPRADGGADYLVSFEGRPRIYAYHDERTPADTRAIPLPKGARGRLGHNRGLEALAYAKAGPLSGAVVAIGERDRQSEETLPGWIIGPGKGASAFTLRRSDNYDATDAAFLPNGDLLLLERRFNLSQGVGMRIRRFPADRLRGARGLDGEVLIDADLSYQIDNMEGLSVDVDGSGRVLLTVISDDNRSILQRTLLLRFAYDGAASAVVPPAGAPSAGPRSKPTR